MSSQRVDASLYLVCTLTHVRQRQKRILCVGTFTHQVSEVVSVFASHQPTGVAEARDVLDVGLQTRWVGFEHNVNKRRQEVIGRRRLVPGDADGAEDVFAAARDAAQLVPRDPLGVHLDNVCERDKDVWDSFVTTADINSFSISTVLVCFQCTDI